MREAKERVAFVAKRLVDEAMVANRCVEVAEPKVALPGSVSAPLFEILKSVEVAERVDEPMAKSVVLVSSAVVCTESFA